MRSIALWALLCACGGSVAQEQDQEPGIVQECRQTFCPASPYEVSYIPYGRDVYQYAGGPIDGHADFICACWCPTREETNRFMDFMTAWPPRADYVDFARGQWAKFCPEAVTSAPNGPR